MTALASAAMAPRDTPAGRVLLLAYYFPPLGGAGVQRTLKWVKYLPEHGWEPTVISTASTAYPARDPSLATELPAETVVRRATEPPLLRWAALALHGLRLRPLYHLATWPDDCAGWAPAALWRTLREVRRARPDVLLSTSAPYTAHLVALVVHRLTGIPWVADFRDEWAMNPHAAELPAWRRRLDRLAERAITRHADRVVVAADYFDLVGAPEGSARRLTIPNGVDEADLPAQPSAPHAPRDVFVLSHVGTLYAEQDCAPVLAALRRLAARGAIDPARFVLRIVGNDWLPPSGEPDPVTVVRTGYVEHARAVDEMASADALLLYVAPSSRAPSGKLFEYLAAERPLLCVTRQDNLAWTLTRDWDAGVCADPEDPAAVEDAILALWRAWEDGTLAPGPDVRDRVLRRFSRRTLTGRLADVLAAAAARDGTATREQEAVA